MTKKDFELIASVLKRNHVAYKKNLNNPHRTHMIEELAVDFAHSLREINPKFNINRFLKAALSQ